MTFQCLVCPKFIVKFLKISNIVKYGAVRIQMKCKLSDSHANGNLKCYRSALK